MDKMKFTQVIPRLRVLETRLLDKAKIDRMVDSNSADEVIKILQETEYSNVMTNVKRAEDYEYMLSAELKRVYDDVYSMSPVRSLVDIMSIKYDYHNIKVILKGMFLEKDFSDMLMGFGTVEASKMKVDIETGSFVVILHPINDHSIQEYVRISLSLGLDPFHISEGPDNQ